MLPPAPHPGLWKADWRDEEERAQTAVRRSILSPHTTECREEIERHTRRGGRGGEGGEREREQTVKSEGASYRRTPLSVETVYPDIFFEPPSCCVEQGAISRVEGFRT